MGRTTCEGSRRRGASHPLTERRSRSQRPVRKKGLVPNKGGTPPAGANKMSSPSVSVLSVAPSAAGGPTRLGLDGAGGRRGSLGNDGGAGGVVRSDTAAAGVHVLPPTTTAAAGSSVYTSSTYAASRGYRPPSGSESQLNHPVAPPRTKATSLTSSPKASATPLSSCGVVKSSSEIFITSGPAPSGGGIAKSSSGILKSPAPLSRSSSGGVLPPHNHVSFSSTVTNSDDGPPPAAAAPPSEPSPMGTSVACLSSPCLTSKVFISLSAPGGRRRTTPETVAISTPTVTSSSPPPSSPSAVQQTPPPRVGHSSSLTFAPPGAPPPVAPPRSRNHKKSSSTRGPTGRTLTREPEEGVHSPQQQQPSSKKSDNTQPPQHYPRAQYPRQKDSQIQHTQPKSVHQQRPREGQPPQQPQAKELKQPQQQEQQQQRGAQHQQQKDVSKISEVQLQHSRLQQKQQQQQQQEAEDHDSKSVRIIKVQQQKETESQEKLRQVQREAERQESLRQQQVRPKQVQQLQRSPKVDIPAAKHRSGEEHYREQHYQQLVRAGSLSSGEPAAILEQRRSRSPLPAPNRAQQQSTTTTSEKGFIPPIVPAVREVPVIQTGEERKSSVTKSSEPRGSLSQETVYVEHSKTVERGHTNTGRSPDAAPRLVSLPPTTVAAAETRTEVIRAAAKAYTENFQSYSFSGYLTKTRKDSATAKEAPVVCKDSPEATGEVRLPPAGSNTPRENESPAATTSTPAKPYTRGPGGKIIVPLSSFVPAGKSSESVTNLDKAVTKSQIGGDKEHVTPKPSTPETTKDASPTTTTNTTAATGPKPIDHKVEQSKGKGHSSSVKDQPSTTHQQPTRGPHHQKEQPTKTSREKPIGSSSNSSTTNTRSSSTTSTNPTSVGKKHHKTLPPLLSGFRFPHIGDKMKGSSEGALLVACRVGEEDQVVRLLKELTASGVLEVTELNQTDRSGRTALSYACANAFQRVVETVTALPGIDINRPDTDGNTPLHFAAQAGHTEVVSHLVNKCNRSVDLDARNALGFTPLMKAALQGRTKIAKILLFAGASPHLRDFGRGLCAVEWARYTGRHVCSELIDSVQKSCSSHIRDRWTSDPDLKSHSTTSINTLGQADNKESWIKHKIKKAFHKSESKKEFSVATNLSTMAVCATSPLLPTAVSQDGKTHQVVVPHVQVTEVKVPDCYEDPEDILTRLPPPPPPPLPPPEDVPVSPSKTSKKHPPKSSPPSTTTTAATTSGSPPASPPASTSTSPPSSPTAATSSAKPSSPPSSPTASTSAAAAAAAVAASSASPDGSQSDDKAGETKSNGAAKSIVSSSKVPFTSSKKRK